MADGIKTYKIVINGITESIDAIDSLNRQLDVLSRKIDELSSKTIKIATSTSSSSSTGGDTKKSSSKSSLTEEEKLERQIAQIDEKREAYSKNIYQSYLAAKDVLKETLNDQKQIASEERLQANTYTNTMQGLKQKLADIKNVMQTTDIGSDIFKKYTKEANEITNKLKELEQAYGQFGRNVGNYASAADGFNKITVAVGNTVREYDNYKQAVKDLKAERFQLSQTIGTEAEEYKNVDIALKKLESDYKDLDKSSAFMDGLLDTMQSFSSIAGIGVGLTQLFGIDDSDFQESMKRITSLLLVLKSIETLKQQWDKDESWLIKPFKRFYEQLNEWGANAYEKIGNGFLSFYNKRNDKNFHNEEFINNLRKKYDKEFEKIGDDAARKLVDGYYKQLGTKVPAVWEELEDDTKKYLYATTNLFIKQITNATAILNGFAKTIKFIFKSLFSVFTLGLSLLLPEVLEAFTNFAKSLNIAKIQGDKAAESMKAVNRQLEIQKNLLSSQFWKGEISGEEYLKRLYNEESNALEKQIELLRLRADAAKDNGVLGTGIAKQSENIDFSGNKISSGKTTLSSGLLYSLDLTVEGIEGVEEAWKQCEEAIAEGQDYLSKHGEGLGNWFSSLFVTVKDTENVMRGLGNMKLSDFISSFDEVNKQLKNGKISTEQYAKELAKLRTEMNSNEILNTVIANLDKYIPDEEVREAVQNIINEINRLDDAFNKTSEAQLHYWEQVRIDAMKDGAKKTMAQIQENERHELAEYGKTKEQQNLIQAKYNRQRLDAQARYNKEANDKAKAAGEKLKAAENELMAARIENMKEGLNKRLAEIENERRLALQKAKDNGIRVGEFELEINKKYDRKIIEEKRKWAFEVIKTYEDLASRINQINKATFEKEVSTASQNIENKQNQGLLDAGYSMITPTNYDDTNALEEYYRKVIDIRKNAIEREASVQQEGLDKQLEIAKNEEELRHKRAIDLNNGEYVQQLRNGKITQEQYDKLMEDEKDAHNARMHALDTEYAANSVKITAESLENQQKLYSDFYGNVLNNLRRDKSKVDEVLSMQPVADKAGWNVVNIGKTSSNYKKALADYDNIKKEIIKKQRELEVALKAGRIKPEDFAVRKEELDNELKGIDKSVQDVVDRQKNLVSNFVQSLMPYIQAGANAFNDIMNAVWSAQETQFDKEQEALNKENEMIQDALSKQDEIIEQHKNKVESIEDELANSRGARRQHLIDQLNAEMEAERRAQKEKERLQKLEEANKKKQDKLDEERKRAEYQRNMIQAVVNGAMAITYAMLNTWPIPAIPMMALAASTTATQLAIMAANKPYAKGGMLDGGGGVAVGPRHRDGGIPVLGGRASIEGGEFITNRVTTQYNAPLLEYINSKKKRVDVTDLIDFYTGNKVRKNIQGIKTKYADGGALPMLPNSLDIRDQLSNVIVNQDNRPIYVTVTDIQNKMDDVKYVKTLAGLEG